MATEEVPRRYRGRRAHGRGAQPAKSGPDQENAALLRRSSVVMRRTSSGEDLPADAKWSAGSEDLRRLSQPRKRVRSRPRCRCGTVAAESSKAATHQRRVDDHEPDRSNHHERTLDWLTLIGKRAVYTPFFQNADLPLSSAGSAIGSSQRSGSAARSSFACSCGGAFGCVIGGVGVGLCGGGAS